MIQISDPPTPEPAPEISLDDLDWLEKNLFGQTSSAAEKQRVFGDSSFPEDELGNANANPVMPADFTKNGQKPAAEKKSVLRRPSAAAAAAAAPAAAPKKIPSASAKKMKAMETKKTKPDEDDDTKETDLIRSYLNFEGPEERHKYYKRPHSKVWHDERNRCLRNGHSDEYAKNQAAKAARSTIERWNKASADRGLDVN